MAACVCGVLGDGQRHALMCCTCSVQFAYLSYFVRLLARISRAVRNVCAVRDRVHSHRMGQLVLTCVCVWAIISLLFFLFHYFMHRIKRKHMQRYATVADWLWNFLRNGKCVLCCAPRNRNDIAFFLLHLGTDESHGRSPSSLCCCPPHTNTCSSLRFSVYTHFVFFFFVFARNRQK